MTNGNEYFTLASVSSLPITALSMIRVLTRASGRLESLFCGPFEEFQNWLVKDKDANPYAEVKSITVGNGNMCGIIMLKER